MPVAVKRAYEPPTPADGYRILVDRLWPRGLAKDEIEIDEWLKEAAPSDSLRKSFHKGEVTWSEFRKAYLAELKTHRDELRRLADISKKGSLTIVFSAKDQEHNNAVVFMQYLQMLGGG